MPRVHIVGYTRSIKEREIHSYLENMDMTKIDVAILHDNSMCYGENVLVCIGGVIYPNLGYSYSGLFGVSDSMLLGKAVILLNIPIAQATVTASREYLDTSIHTTLYFKETFGGLLKQRQTELLNNLLGIDKELSEYSFDELDVIANTFISKSQEKLLNRTLVSELILEAIYDKSPSLPSMTFIEEILSCSALETNGIVIYSADRGLITTTPKTIKGILDSKEIVTVAAYEYKAELCGYIASCAADRLDNLLLRNKATYLIGVPRATLHLFRDEQEQYPFKIRSSSLDKAFFHPKVRDAYPPTCRSEKKEASVWEIVVYAKENNNAYNYIVASEKGFKENIHKMVGIYYALTASDLSSLEQNTIFHLDRRNTVHFSNRQLVWLKEVGLTEDFTLHSLQTNTLKDLDKLPYAKLVLMCYTVFTRLNEYNYYTNILNAIQLENNTYRGIRLGFGYNVAKKIHTSGIDFKPFTTEDGRIKVELLTKFIYLLNSLKFIYDSKYIEESEELSNAAIKQDIINKIEEVKNEIYTSEV
jgi:hypothetical protein